jgi:hypothetical protein
MCANNFESFGRVQLSFISVPDKSPISLKELGEHDKEVPHPFNIAKHSTREFEGLRVADSEVGLFADPPDIIVVRFVEWVHVEESLAEPVAVEDC